MNKNQVIYNVYNLDFFSQDTFFKMIKLNCTYFSLIKQFSYTFLKNLINTGLNGCAT